MKVTFVLPPNKDVAVGGYKIVYQYANELVQRGHHVNIVFLRHIYPSFNFIAFQKFETFVRKILKRPKNKKSITWFELDSRVSLFFDVTSKKDFPDADVIVATAAPTTYIKYLSSIKGKKFYFIQNFETWWYDEKEKDLEKTFEIPNMTNIVISHELRDKIQKVTKTTPKYLPNFYNPDEFYLSEPIVPRENVVSLLNHSQKTKRTEFGIEILKEVKKEIPDLKVELFGAYDVPYPLPEYFHFTKNANAFQLRQQIYGCSKIYLLPSILEGWGLTGMEAMACGAVLVSSEIGGITDYANNNNSILINPNNKDKFIESIIYLLKNSEKQQQIANKGYRDVQQYRIEKSTNILESILKGM